MKHNLKSDLDKPQLEFCILKTLRHEINRLVGLVLIRLHRSLLGDERLVLRLFRQRVLWRQVRVSRET